jgi:hypothetical protein
MQLLYFQGAPYLRQSTEQESRYCYGDKILVEETNVDEVMVEDATAGTDPTEKEQSNEERTKKNNRKLPIENFGDVIIEDARNDPTEIDNEQTAK